jgi:hypothetical protein
MTNRQLRETQAMMEAVNDLREIKISRLGPAF